jgi:uncharacterized membrane protein
MLPLMIDFASLLLSALLVGAMFCVWLVFNPARLDAAHYIFLQQNGIRTLHPIMPLLGGLTILMTAGAALLAREDKTRMSLLAAAAIFFVISGLITRFQNQPINAIILGWNSAAPPERWTELRDAWWQWHCIRLGSGLTGLGLTIVAMLARKPPELSRVLLGALTRVVCLLI